jgi:two-component system, chemotaxis family, sensor kinase CheA
MFVSALLRKIRVPMDDLLRDFVVETVESIDVVDNQLVRFEREPNNRAIIDQIFRLVHTIKGTCGFLGLPRLETLTHAAETALDRYRDGAAVTSDAVTLILSTIDRIKVIMAELDRSQTEPEGHDSDLIAALETLASQTSVPSAQGSAAQGNTGKVNTQTPADTDFTTGSLIYQVLERKLRPGEASLDELERAFREATQDEDFTDEQLEKAGLNDHTPEPTPETSQPFAEETADNTTGHAVRNNTIRVPVDTLEHLMTMVSELVLTRNQLLDIARKDDNSAYKVPLQRLSHVTAELQESVMKTRMQPIGTAWAKLPRLMRDLAHDLNKDIVLHTLGAETEIDRQLLELIKDPMIHMIRNAADHGIESPGDRMKYGKPAQGTIRVTAAQEGGNITLSIADDGRGLDLKRIREKAIRLGLTTAVDAGRLTDAQVARFIFHPGFSTADKLTSISGRGVGMDVVRTNIEQMGGAVDVRTTAGQGTTVDIKIPLTLAIAAALIVQANGQRFALPQSAVVELVKPSGSSEARIEHISQSPVLRLRNRLLPLVPLARILGIEAAETRPLENAFIVVCQVGGIRFGIVVDAVLQTEEIVVKPVSQQIRHIASFSGSTIMGDGAVIMILDPNGLVQTIGNLGDAHNDNIAGLAEAATDAEERSTLLVFRAGNGSPMAVPLALITRLEEIEVDRIEIASGQRLVQYRGKLMRLVLGNDEMEMRTQGNQPVVVFAQGNFTVGLMVDQIIDIVNEKLDISFAGAKAGIIGSAVLRGKATDIIDVAHHVPELRDNHEKRPAEKPSLLLVAPSEFLRAMLGPVLQAAGFSVSQAGTAQEARARISSGDFAIVVAGIDDRDCLDLTATASHTTRFVGLASHASKALLEDAAQAGFEDVVGFFDREGLLGCIARMRQVMENAA